MNQVKLYSTPSCVYCKMARDFFDKHNIPYEEHNVVTDEKAREEMIMKSHQLGVPVIEIEGQIFVGFNRGALEKTLKVAA